MISFSFRILLREMDNLKAKRLERLDAMKRKSLKKKKKQLGVRAPNQKQKIFSRPGSSSGSTATGSPSFQKRKGGSGRGIQGGKSGGARGEGVTELIESILRKFSNSRFSPLSLPLSLSPSLPLSLSPSFPLSHLLQYVLEAFCFF